MNNCEWMSVILVPWLRFLEVALILPKRDNKNKHNAQTLSRQRVISRSPKFHKFQRFLKFWNFRLSPETFLTGRIPDLKFYSFSVKFDCSDFKVDSNCRNVTLLIIFIYFKSLISLTNAKFHLYYVNLTDLISCLNLRNQYF